MNRAAREAARQQEAADRAEREAAWEKEFSRRNRRDTAWRVTMYSALGLALAIAVGLWVWSIVEISAAEIRSANGEPAYEKTITLEDGSTAVCIRPTALGNWACEFEGDR